MTYNVTNISAGMEIELKALEELKEEFPEFPGILPVSCPSVVREMIQYLGKTYTVFKTTSNSICLNGVRSREEHGDDYWYWGFCLIKKTHGIKKSEETLKDWK